MPATAGPTVEPGTKVVRGFEGPRVGDRLRIELRSTDLDRHGRALVTS